MVFGPLSLSFGRKSLGVRSLETGLKPYFFQSRECAVFDALFSDTLLVLEIYILLEIRRYLV